MNLTRLSFSSVVVLGLASVAGCKPTSQEPTVNPAPTNAMPAVHFSNEPPSPESMLDADQKKVLDELKLLGAKPIENLTPEDARKQPSPADAVKSLLTKAGKSTAPEAVGKVEDKSIPGPAGQIKARVYTPKSGTAPYPVIAYFHGGGFVIADLDTYDASPRSLANGAEAIVVSLDYRHAPEDKFPASHDDAIAGYEWVLKNAASIGGDPKRVAVAGESAGGNLALNVAIAARDKGEQMPVHALLVYPVASNDTDSKSYKQFANARPLDKAMMKWFFQNELRTPADANDPRLDLVAANLKGLPPTTILNAQIDPLASDGEALAGKLEAAGVKVERKVYDGVAHEFFGQGAVVSDAKSAMDDATSRLKKSFAR